MPWPDRIDYDEIGIARLVIILISSNSSISTSYTYHMSFAGTFESQGRRIYGAVVGHPGYAYIRGFSNLKEVYRQNATGILYVKLYVQAMHEADR